MTVAMPDAPATPPVASKFYTYADVRVLLGNVSHATVYRLALDGEIDKFMVRNVPRFTKASVHAYLRRRDAGHAGR